jgi:hypothetical protein
LETQIKNGEFELLSFSAGILYTVLPFSQLFFFWQMEKKTYNGSISDSKYIMYKKILPIITVILATTGCFGGGGTAETVDTQQWLKQEFSTFSISIPPGWHRIDKEKLSSSIPQGTVVVYAAAIENGFMKNINIVKETLNTTATPKEYARANITLAQRTLPQYNLSQSSDVDIHGQQTLMHTFTAKNSISDDTLHFAQSYFVKDNIGYTITCVLQQSAPVEQQDLCRTSISSFLLK